MLEEADGTPAEMTPSSFFVSPLSLYPLLAHCSLGRRMCFTDYKAPPWSWEGKEIVGTLPEWGMQCGVGQLASQRLD